MLSEQELRPSRDGRAVVCCVSLGTLVVVGYCDMGRHARLVRAGSGKQTEPAWETIAAICLVAAEADAGAPGVARSNQAAIDCYIFHD